MPNKDAVDAADAVAGLAARHSSAHDFALNAIDLVLVRLEGLASRESVDTVELQSVSDELRSVRRELAVKVARI